MAAADRLPRRIRLSVVRIDAGQHEISLRQSGQMQSKPMQISPDIANGPVRGTALTPTHPAGLLSIDTTVAVGTIDENAVMPLMSAVRWRDSLSITFPVIASGSGIVEPWSLRLLGANSTTVPAAISTRGRSRCVRRALACSFMSHELHRSASCV